MKIGICLGTYSLVQFARLNLACLRRVFGADAPICVYDGRSNASEQIEAVADEYGAVYLGERVNRGHFGGDIQAAVSAIAFAQANECDIAIKLNQRTVLLSPKIPDLIESSFDDDRVSLVTPKRYPEASIIEPSSRFHARFPAAVDVLMFRSSAWDAQGVADRYREQWTTGTTKYACYSEEFWANEIKRVGDGYRSEDWLTTHVKGEPFKYLRKIQNRQQDYAKAAMDIGLPVGRFDCAEWKEMKRGNYSPAPRA